MEPFTTALVGALAAGALAAAKDTATKAIKDSYAGIREYIKDRYAKVKLDDLEKEPQSRGQQLVVKEKLEEAQAEQDAMLPKLLESLVTALKDQAPDAAKIVGVDLEQIHAAINVQIRRVGESGPVNIKDIEARGGSVVIEDVGVPGKK